MRRLTLPPIVMLICAAAMWLLDRLLPMAALPAPWHWGGALLIAAGIAIAQWHARLFKRLGTNIDTFGEPGRLTTAGLFAHTRNPIYLGMLIALSGLAWMLGSVACWLLVALFAGLLQFWYIPHEERAMAAKFGKQFEEYCQRVPRWLV